MKRMMTLISGYPDQPPMSGYCYKHRGPCRFYGPDDLDPVVFRVVVAGTTCTSWSRMGKNKKWAASSAVAFIVWAYTTLWQVPDAIVHECTPDFDVAMMTLIFGSLYVIQSLVFSPCDRGLPTSRPRRYTLLLLRARCNPTLSYDLLGFGGLFFRHCIMTGHVFWEAPDHMVSSFGARLASLRGLPAEQSDGQLWPWRDLLPTTLLVRLIGYERLCRKRNKPPTYIVNLLQNAFWMSSLSDTVPTLLTKTSLLWSGYPHIRSKSDPV